MQTFLPYPDFEKSSATLHMKHLGKQRVENLQIMKALLLPEQNPQSIVNHPVTAMWRGYESALMHYQAAITHEWHDVRGYKDTCWQKLLNIFLDNSDDTNSFDVPPWLGDPVIHAAYRGRLLEKKPEWYSQFGWTDSVVTDFKPYYPKKVNA